MCGLLGCIGNVDINLFIDALTKQSHRGPDDWSYCLVDNVVLGHRRLSIIDLSSNAKQPMIAGCGDLIGVFNGEIYNYLEIRNDLEEKGYKFKTNSDTEVLINAYHFYGEKSLEMFNGMFSFAIYNKKNNETFLARDRLGIKPLFYSKRNGKFVFSSEVKSILAICRNRKELNLRAVSSYLSYRYPILNDTFYNGIEQLPPGTYMKISPSGSFRIVQYWDLRDKVYEQDIDRGEEYYLSELKKIFNSSVKYRMISDVPIGAYLSGGVDSSAVVAEMSMMSSSPVKTFTIGFNEKGYNEFEYAKLVADKYKVDHMEIDLTAEGYFDKMSELIRFKDAPMGVPNEVALYLMSKELKNHVSVVLSGEGADEIFGGYGRIFRSSEDYEKLNRRNISKELLARLHTKYGKKKFKNQLDHFLFLYRYVGVEQKKDIFCDHINDKNFDCELDSGFRTVFNSLDCSDYLSKMMFTFERLHLPGLLQRVDVSTMAASVEARVPFVDHRLVEFAFTIPNKYKLKWNCDSSLVDSLLGHEISERYDTPKYILKKAFEGRLPSDVLYRKKVGFPVPLSRWFGSDFIRNVESRLLNGLLVDYDIFKKSRIEVLIKSVEENKNSSLSMLLWMLLNLEMFIEDF
nr:asparagine synthase (glutamine-hydrolyzing) [uncultured Desulfuromonas sp.]